jgi:hypothetical protein
MNIAIIEKGHFEVAYTLISLFDNGHNNITVLVEENSYQQLQLMLAEKANHYTWVIKEKNESNRRFIYRIFYFLQQHSFDLIYFNTIEDNFIVYAYYLQRLKTKKIVLTLHDINGFFHYQPSLSIRRMVRYIGKKRLLKIIPSFNVLSETLETRLRSGLQASKKIYTIQGSFFDPECFTPLSFSTGDTLSLIIPGSVDTRRRNYDLVFDLLYTARQRNIKISVTLLGAFKKGYSENIQKKCTEYLQTNNNLHIYQSSIVDQPEFDSVMRQSHFIWTPLQFASSISDGVKEQYGISTCSGNIADIIRYAKPFFAPGQLPLENYLEKCSSGYTTITDIIHVLEQLTPGKYNSMQELAYQASLHYTKDKIISRNAGLFI